MPQKERTEEWFLDGLQRLKAYVARVGNARPPARYRDPDGYALGSWVWLRRQSYRRGQLSERHVRELEALPRWSWNPRQDYFTTGVRLLTVFARRHRHVFVPSGTVEQGFPLAAWAARMRTVARSKHLSPDKRRALEAIPHWGTTRADWLPQLLADLEQLLQAQGHLRIPHRTHRQLAARAHTVRTAYHAGRIRPDVVAALNEMPGWSWAPKGDAWTRAVEAFRAFTSRSRHGRIPGSIRERGVLLSAWVRLQRKRYCQGRLEPHRIRTLERIPHWSWAPERDRWAAALAALRLYARRTASAWPPLDCVVRGLRLGVWVRTLRSRYKRHTLSAQEIRDVERIPGWRWAEARRRQRTPTGATR